MTRPLMSWTQALDYCESQTIDGVNLKLATFKTLDQWEDLEDIAESTSICTTHACN